MRDSGVEIAEIGRRIGKSSDRVEKIIDWTAIPRSRPPIRRSPSAIERRVVALREAGETHDQIGERFQRGARYIRQVEGLAHYRMGVDLLARSEKAPDTP